MPLLSLSMLATLWSPLLPAIDEPELPFGFRVFELRPDWNQPVGLCFAPDGRMYVWEKNGRVWVVEYGSRHVEPFLDISEEVGNFSSHGLKGFALDPDFYENGHVYLLYDVDRHHLFYYGTPQYDPDADDFQNPTIARLTRYTGNAADGYRTADPATRKVLLGETVDTGIPQLHIHECGTVLFGADGSLLVSTGDGGWVAPADFGGDDRSVQAVQEGILSPEEDIGVYRSQMLDSHCGKILRLDPATGDGLADNPYFEASLPRSPRSRVWSLGLRNPYRIALIPSGRIGGNEDGDIPSPNMTLDPENLPGLIAVGDVGNHDFEELDLVTGPGLNFGWPIFEGTEPQLPYGSVLTYNLEASNPLYNIEIPGIGLCTQRYFYFQELLVQDSTNPPSWANPCDPAQQVPASVPTFVHERPRLAYGQEVGSASEVPIYDGNGEAAISLVHPSAQIPGPLFHGGCIIGGGFATGQSFPQTYDGAFLMGDYGTGFIKRVKFSHAHDVTSIEDFAQPVGRLVDLAVNPADGTMYYIDYLNTGAGRLHRVSFLGDNVPPDAVIEVDQASGSTPLTVAFDGTGSSDPEGSELSFAWDFGDGTPIVYVGMPTHTFPSEDITATGVIDTKLFTLDPPSAMGISNWDPETIRDGVFPPLGTTEFNLQYDTRHFQQPGQVPDKGGDDWIGYRFATPRAFVGLIYQEGMLLANGGALHDLEIQVQDADTGEWVKVDSVYSTPNYVPESGAFFETFHFRFPEVTGTGIRIFGIPSGAGEYFCIGELRVLALPADGAMVRPMNQLVTLTVTDGAGASAETTQVISLDNSPPVVSIDMPLNLSSYDTLIPELVNLTGTAADAEHDLSELECSWQVLLHHEDHNHPETPSVLCVDQATLPVDGCLGDGDVHYVEVAFTVTDPLGLSTTVSHWLTPDCDRNLNGWADSQDIALGTSEDLDLNGVPDEAEVDCNGNGMPDLFEVFLGYRPDANGNGIPDDCEGLILEGEIAIDPGSPSGPQ